MPSRNWTALVVDDEHPVRGFIADCLKLRGLKTLSAPDGLSALDLSRGHEGPIHLLVSDVHMPGLAGTEVAKVLSVERPELKIIIVSGEVSPRFEEKLPPSWRFIRKPFPAVALLEAVGSLLNP